MVGLDIVLDSIKAKKRSLLAHMLIGLANKANLHQFLAEEIPALFYFTVQQMCAQMVAPDLEEAQKQLLLKKYGFQATLSVE
jgi:hypothetical protein